MPGTSRTGGQIIVDALAINHVDRIFSIPGESFLAVLDALHDKPQIELTTCRQEGGAAYMAEAYGKLTGRPGICLVTRGPGATNASCGLHVAMQDSTPMILLIGQIARKDMDREAFQEIDYRRMFGQVAKWVAQIEDAARIPEYMNRAFATATSGRPGPVVLALPEDMLTDITEVPDAKPWKHVAIHPSSEDIDKTVEMLSSANRPIIMVGGGGWNQPTGTALQEFAKESAIPIVNSFRCQDYVDNEHPNYIGDVGIGVNPALATRIREADCLLVIGARLGEMTTGGFELIDIPNPQQTFIHVHAGAEELGHIYQPDLAINSTSPAFVAALKDRRLRRRDNAEDDLSRSRKIYENWNASIHTESQLELSEIIKIVKDNTDDDAIICNGAGNNTAWLHRFYQYRKYRSQLAPTSGTMGYGVPAAIAAKIISPEKTVVAFAGDGDFMMNGQELATAMQYAAKIIVIVVNNGIYGTIRMHQEREYPRRVIGTDMVNPDFCALAKAYGMESELVTATGQFEPAFDRALKAKQAFLIELQIGPSVLTPTTTIESLRAL
ncbi:MAG: thiamine pyrophosphate-binding protein [Gammaproteobacteria bacterium]|nr:thiamine pyrophosphate-binding protein [Gammaproteobacteria bacterium]